MLNIDSQTWVVVANGSECKIFSIENRKTGLKLLKEFYSTSAHLKSVKLGTDRPGRVHESNNATRHAIEPKSNLHYKEKTKFSNLIANYLNKAAVQIHFHHLIVTASPEFLGELRKKLSKNTNLLIAREVNKDLIHLQEKNILEALS